MSSLLLIVLVVGFWMAVSTLLKTVPDSKRAAAQNLANALRSERDRFLASVFALTATLAKADGHVSEAEVRVAERLFDKFRIPPTERQKFKDIFNAVLKHPRHFTAYADAVGRATAGGSVAVFLYELLWDIAYADGELDPSEDAILREICSFLRISESYYALNRRRRAGTSYDVLGCAEAATDDEVKAAYHRAAKAYHPDLLRAKGVPEAAIALANEKMIRLNRAWEEIKKSRGL